MATNERKANTNGRTTPKGGGKKVPPAKAGPVKRGPLNPDKPVTIGRRPSSPGFLAIVAVMWLAVGVVVILTLHSTWKLVPAILAIGIGLMFLRGAGATVMRRERRRSSEQ
jgi:hypothetical protein